MSFSNTFPEGRGLSPNNCLSISRSFNSSINLRININRKRHIVPRTLSWEIRLNDNWLILLNKYKKLDEIRNEESNLTGKGYISSK
jgi:hypothetical protein